MVAGKLGGALTGPAPIGLVEGAAIGKAKGEGHVLHPPMLFGEIPPRQLAAQLVEDVLVAGALRMSARNLRRLLEAENTSYKYILDEVRCELARRYLTQEQRGVEEVAFALGFSDGSAFHKAFRRWTSESPTDFARNPSRAEEPA